MVCFSRQKSDYVKGKKKLKSKHKYNEHVYLLSDGGPDYLACTVLYCTVLLTVLTFSLMADLMTSRSSSCLRYFCLRSLSACLMASCLNNKTSQSNSGIVISLLPENNSENFDLCIRYPLYQIYLLTDYSSKETRLHISCSNEMKCGQ